MVFKTIEVLGRRRERMKRKAASNLTGTDSPEDEKNDQDSGSTSGNISRSRTMDSSTTVSTEEAPLRGIRQCNAAVRKDWRIPGQ